MTIAPEPLKLVGSLEINGTLAQLIQFFTEHGWHNNQGTCLRHDSMELHLEGEQWVLLHGQLDVLEQLPVLIETLREAGAQWQIDVFEEDGRLVKKLQG